VEDALPRVLERWMAVNVGQFALDFSLRGMADVKALDVVPRVREVQVGVIDIRTWYIQSDDEIVDRGQGPDQVVAVVGPGLLAG
jgi:methionine synthase II (cobalamin-independent)